MTGRVKIRERGSFIGDDRYHFVYQLWDGSGQCLYVGYTHNLTNLTHSKQPWFEDVARVEAKRYRGRKWALDVEKELIAEHQPLHNKQGTERYTATLSGRPRA